MSYHVTLTVQVQSGVKAEIKEPRRSSRPHKPKPCYIDAAGIKL